MCGTDSRDIFSTEDNVIGSVNLPSVSRQAHIIRANGDSMEPEIYDGNMVAVREINHGTIFSTGRFTSSSLMGTV